jgi:diaminopimelate epimerase
MSPVESREAIRLRVWERGADAGLRHGRLRHGGGARRGLVERRVRVALPGGHW